MWFNFQDLSLSGSDKKNIIDADPAQFHAQKRLFLDAAAAAEREAPTRFVLDTA